MEGNFESAVQIIPEVELFINENLNNLELHKRMLFYYKIACLYFGNCQYEECLASLNRIIETRDHTIRRDLQCYARILSLIAHYELGAENNISRQIRSLYSFLVKMNDMHKTQAELIGFIRQMRSIKKEQDFHRELVNLHKRLKVLESHPYERRTFFYLDIISWLESKIEGISMAEVIRNKFNNRKQ